MSLICSGKHTVLQWASNHKSGSRDNRSVLRVSVELNSYLFLGFQCSFPLVCHDVCDWKLCIRVWCLLLSARVGTLGVALLYNKFTYSYATLVCLRVQLDSIYLDGTTCVGGFVISQLVGELIQMSYVGRKGRDIPGFWRKIKLKEPSMGLAGKPGWVIHLAENVIHDGGNMAFHLDGT